MLVRGATPNRAIVAGQGLTAVNGTHEGANRRILTALVTGTPQEPAYEEQAHWIKESDNDPVALLNLLNTIIPTPEPALRKIETPTLVAVGTEDENQSTADALAALLPNGHFTKVPGNHFTAMANLTDAITAFLA